MMLFQFPTYYGSSGGQIQTAIWTLQQWGLLDAFLPFLLFFAIIFATLQKIAIFKTGEGATAKVDRKINGVLGAVISALIVLPHVTRTYPPQMDPVNIMLNILPQAGLLFLVLFLVLIMIGLAAKEIPTIGSQIVAFFAVVLLGIIVLFAIWPAFQPNWLALDYTTWTLAIVLLVFGGVVWFITSEPAAPNTTPFTDFIKNFFGKGG